MANANEKTSEVMQLLEDGVKAVFTSEKYLEYLKFSSKFHNYSFNNTLLILLQNPNASYVAGFNDWKKKHNRYVKKGEKGLRIIAPVPYKTKVDIPVYDSNNNPVIIDGKPLTEEKTIQKLSFKVVSVFDISQTDGEPIPELTSELKANVENYADLFAAIQAYSEYPIEFIDIDDGAKGKCNFLDKKISINNGMSESQNIKTALHEVAHSKLHEPNLDDIDENIVLARRTKEVQAESVAFIVANHFGIDTSEYSFEYIAGWSKDKELSDLKESLDTIQKEANNMIQGIQEQYDLIIKSKTVEQVVDSPEQGVDRDMDGISDERDSSFSDTDFSLNVDLIRQANAVSLTDMGDIINRSFLKHVDVINGLNLSVEIKEEALQHITAMYNEQLTLQTGAVNPYVSGVAKIVNGSQEKSELVAQKQADINSYIQNLQKQSEKNNISDKQNRIVTTLREATKNGDKQVTIDGVTYYKGRKNWSTEPPKTKGHKNTIPKYSKEENDRITAEIKSSIPIQDYAHQMGFTVQSVGSYYTLQEHDSVRIDPRKNRFVQNSTGINGSIIDFVMHFENLDKATAIDKLAKHINASPLPPAQVKSVTPAQSTEKQPLVLPEKAKSMKNIFAYLINTRKIDSQVVSQWVKNGNLYQDTHNNCVFVTYDNYGKPNFASQRGTNTNKPFRADVIGSNYDTCHFINNNAPNLIVGEAVIDIMSVQTILKSKGRDLNNYNYLSTNGTTKTHAVINALKSSNTEKVILATDNDNAGREARNTLRALISEFDKNIQIVDFVPQNEKDWNAELVANVLKEEQQQSKDTSLADKISECQHKADLQNQNLSPTQSKTKDKKPDLSDF